MHRKYIALIFATALAITSFDTRTAHAASDDDIARWIAGIAALAIIGAAVSDRNDNRSNRKVTHGSRHSNAKSHNWARHGNVTRHKQTKRNRYALPAKCRVAGNLQGHTVRGFSARCLQRNNVNVQALPRHCALRYRDRNKPVTVFTGRCLRQQGYTVARH